MSGVTTFDCPSPVLPACPWATKPLLALAVLIGAAAWYGSDRQPVDATEPIMLRGETPSQAGDDRFRIGTFNIHGGRGPDCPTDLEATAAVLRGDDLDLVGLYEVYGSFTTDQAGDLGDRLGMASVFAGTERRWWHDHFGNGLLIGRRVREVVRITLPGTQGKRFRNALLTTFDAGGTTVRVIATHIDTETDRERQLAVVFELFRSLESPAVLMGDLNCETDHPLLADLLDEPGVVDAVAAKVDLSSNEDRIDHLLVRGLDVLDAGYVKTDASDHPYVWADLAVAEKP
ncbi:MAG: endonuclease/exonuclease/phosphatase family protein [Planctomycetaceae bacterium]